MAEEDDIEAWMNRKAVALGPQTAITLNVLRTRGSLFDTFGIEYEDTRKAQRAAAIELMNHIKSECSINLLWSIREACAELIAEHNEQFGTKFPVDCPD